MIILLYHYSRPHRLHPEMELIFGIQKSRISAIIQTFSEALYNVAINYMVNPEIWHQRMPYYAELISNNLEELQETFGDLSMELFIKPLDLYTTNGPCIPDSKMSWLEIPICVCS